MLKEWNLPAQNNAQSKEYKYNVDEIENQNFEFRSVFFFEIEDNQAHKSKREITAIDYWKLALHPLRLVKAQVIDNCTKRNKANPEWNFFEE